MTCNNNFYVIELDYSTKSYQMFNWRATTSIWYLRQHLQVCHVQQRRLIRLESGTKTHQPDRYWDIALERALHKHGRGSLHVAQKRGKNYKQNSEFARANSKANSSDSSDSSVNTLPQLAKHRGKPRPRAEDEEFDSMLRDQVVCSGEKQRSFERKSRRVEEKSGSVNRVSGNSDGPSKLRAFVNAKPVPANVKKPSALSFTRTQHVKKPLAGPAYVNLVRQITDQITATSGLQKRLKLREELFQLKLERQRFKRKKKADRKAARKQEAAAKPEKKKLRKLVEEENFENQSIQERCAVEHSIASVSGPGLAQSDNCGNATGSCTSSEKRDEKDEKPLEKREIFTASHDHESYGSCPQAVAPTAGPGELQKIVSHKTSTHSGDEATSVCSGQHGEDYFDREQVEPLSQVSQKRMTRRQRRAEKQRQKRQQRKQRLVDKVSYIPVDETVKPNIPSQVVDRYRFRIYRGSTFDPR